MINRRRPLREPIFNLPGTVLAAILLLFSVHAIRDLLVPDGTDVRLVLDFAVIPARWNVALGAASIDEVLQAIGTKARQTQTGLVALAYYVLSGVELKPWTMVTYAFLHGSWAHVLFNSLWLAAFGTPVVRRCGATRFVILGIAAAVGGAIAHIAVHPLQVIPMVGASAAVSGLTAAAAWFMFARPAWLLEGRLTEPHERPRESLRSMFSNRQVLIFLLVWFGTNFMSAYVAQPLGITDASIAWEAHIGGFLVGLVMFPLLDPVGPPEVQTG